MSALCQAKILLVCTEFERGEGLEDVLLTVTVPRNELLPSEQFRRDLGLWYHSAHPLLNFSRRR